jgi:hypothetical protein
MHPPLAANHPLPMHNLLHSNSFAAVFASLRALHRHSSYLIQIRFESTLSIVSIALCNC